MLDPALLAATDIDKGDLLFVVVKDASMANIDELQNELNEHFEPRGVLAIASAFEIELHQASVPKPGELLWISVEGATEKELADTRAELDEHLNLAEGDAVGAILLANFAPEVVEMDEEKLWKTRAMLDHMFEFAKERRSKIEMVFPNKGTVPTPRSNPAYFEQLDRDNALFSETEAFMAAQLVNAGYVVPANMRDLIAEFVMACENPPVETASTSKASTTIYAEDADGHQTVLGTADTWLRTESRETTSRMSMSEPGKVEAIEPVPGSYRGTLTLIGFIPANPEKP